MGDIHSKSINAIRILSVDAVQKANSGHPGLPLGAAPMAYELWGKYMKHNPKNPNWVNRDRFILSAGHGSAMLYSLLHLFGYGDLSIEDLKQFRQMDSKTPGHPEYGDTVGVEATTGPLGAGIGTGVGMAMAEAHLAAKFNKEGYPIIDHYTYLLAGDGDLMEGISSEALSLAGTLALDKLIILYDSNRITIEGSTDLAFTEDVEMRMKAFGFQTLMVEDGNDTKAIGKAIEEAKKEKNKPSFITIKTEIGFGSPGHQGKASAHGSPLGPEDIVGLRKALTWEHEEDFYVPKEVYDNFKEITKRNEKIEEEWNEMFDKYSKEYPEMKELWDKYYDKNIGKDLIDDADYWSYEDKPNSTRNLSGIAINKLKDVLPNLIGGSADLAPSNITEIIGEESFSKDNYGGRNLHFGVREMAMAAIGNGLVLHGGLKPYVATFLIFSDYMKPMIRLAALMKIPTIFVLTHDSIGVGEDGPTHEPIEQLAMLRGTPNLSVFRPADAVETLAAWYYGITSTKTPTALALSRQNLPQLEGSSQDALKGGYIIEDSDKEVPDGILMASGSEVSLALEAKKALKEEGFDLRVVSMPSMDVFEEQSKEYKESVLPKAVRKRVAIEAAADISWGKYVGLDGDYVTMTTFGASAPGDELFKRFGFTVENVVKVFKAL